MRLTLKQLMALNEIKLIISMDSFCVKRSINLKVEYSNCSFQQMSYFLKKTSGKAISSSMKEHFALIINCLFLVFSLLLLLRLSHSCHFGIFDEKSIKNGFSCAI